MSKNVILSFMGAAIFALLAGLVVTVRRPASIGYYDAQRVYGGSREAKAAQDDVDAKTKELLAAAQRTGGEYEAAVKEKGGPSATVDADPAVAPKRATAVAAQGALKKSQDAAGAAIAAEVNRRIADAVTRLAAARGMTLVMAVSGKMPYAAPECDLTQDIIVAVDAAGPVK